MSEELISEIVQAVYCLVLGLGFLIFMYKMSRDD